MKKHIYRVFTLCLFVLALTSCEDAEITRLQAVSFSSGPVATPSAVVLNLDNQFQDVMTISWPAVAFPVDAPVTYRLQFDRTADISGDNGWANAITVNAGESALSRSFSGAELNDIAHDLGLESDVAGTLVVRIEAYLDRSAYSEPIEITVTPFDVPEVEGVLYVPGAYQGWNPATAATLGEISPGVYQGFLTFPAGQLEFKLTGVPAWDDAMTYGTESGGGTLSSPGTNNLVAPAAGSYLITVNLNNMTYTTAAYSWGIIGTATPGSWDSDTDMVWDYQNQVWSYTGNLVPGALKFRLNDSWTINYGSIDNTEFVAYLDNPGAHTIDVAGNYTVTFSIDASHPASAPYTVTLN